MSRHLPIAQLPERVGPDAAVIAAYDAVIGDVVERLTHGMSVLVECDKELVVHLLVRMRERLKAKEGPRLVLVDGRPKSADGEGRNGLTRMLRQLEDAIRGGVDRQVVCLPHLDVLVSSSGGLSLEAREVIPLLYENPESTVLGFCDPSFAVPPAVRQMFDGVVDIVGVDRSALPRLITQREARVLHRDRFDVFETYKWVSGLNAIRCRKAFASLGMLPEALPGRGLSKRAAQELRRHTTQDGVEVPAVDLDDDIGGYAEVKERLREDLLSMLQALDGEDDVDRVEQMERLLPRGVLFHGPPGTGKTLFAKAIASSMNASVLVVSGPELKSKWVGESEGQLRALFRKARLAAPCVLVFDEIDAFAQTRGTHQGSGVEHSMVNQLLTEMDGFRSNERVFVVGTTNFLESVDAALLRPGRFEFLMEVPAPNEQDREAIVRVVSRQLNLGLDEVQIRHFAKRTGGAADLATHQPYTGDHLAAAARALKRVQLREGGRALTVDDIDASLVRRVRRPVAVSSTEQHIISVHEAGHAVIAMALEHATPPERISLRQDVEGALGYVLRAARAHPYAMREADLRAEICVGLGGYAAEQAVFGHPSIGAHNDLVQATGVARALVEEFGMSQLGVWARQPDDARAHKGPDHRDRVDREVERILREELARATDVIGEHRATVVALAERLVEEEVLDADAIPSLMSATAEQETLDG